MGHNHCVVILIIVRCRDSASLGIIMVSKKEGTSILYLIAGISLVSFVASLVCVVQIFFVVPQHCSCVTSDGNTEAFVLSHEPKNDAILSHKNVDHKQLGNVSITIKESQQASLSKLKETHGQHSRKKRDATTAFNVNNAIATLRQQVFFLESR